jgi:transposase IS481 family protein
MQVHARAPISPIYRWLARLRDHGEAGLVDRAPVAPRKPRKTPPDRVGAMF